MKSKLLNFTMNDGSRKFAEIAGNRSWEQFRRHIERLSGAVVTDFLSDGITEMWLDFFFRGYAFTVNNQFGDFVDDPACPEDILKCVIEYTENLLFNE